MICLTGPTSKRRAMLLQPLTTAIHDINAAQPSKRAKKVITSFFNGIDSGFKNRSAGGALSNLLQRPTGVLAD